jgi:hypothetical protein
MEPLTIATTIAVLFLTKALERTGEKFSDPTVASMSQALAKIGYHAPEIVMGIESGDEHILALHPELLGEMIPAEPIFGEFLAAADAEPNPTLQAQLPDVKAGKILQVMASEMGADLRAKSATQTATGGNELMQQMLFGGLDPMGDEDLGELI